MEKGVKCDQDQLSIRLLLELNCRQNAVFLSVRPKSIMLTKFSSIMYLALLECVAMLANLEYGENVANNDDQGLKYGSK